MASHDEQKQEPNSLDERLDDRVDKLLECALVGLGVRLPMTACAVACVALEAVSCYSCRPIVAV